VLNNPEPRNDDRLKDYFGSVWENLRDRRFLAWSVLLC
jgi:hypothetical protein